MPKKNLLLSFTSQCPFLVGIGVGLAHKKKKEDPEGDLMDWMEEDDEDHGKGFAVAMLVTNVILFFVQIYFVVIIHKFYKFLKETAGLVFPGLPQYHPALPVKEKSMDL